jgi:hypothetical protein
VDKIYLWLKTVIDILMVKTIVHILMVKTVIDILMVKTVIDIFMVKTVIDILMVKTVVDILMVKTVVDILMVLGFLVPNKKSFEKVYWSKKTKGPKQNCQNRPWLHMSEEMDLSLNNYYII